MCETYRCGTTAEVCVNGNAMASWECLDHGELRGALPCIFTVLTWHRTPTDAHTHTRKWDIPATLLDYQGQGRIIPVTQRRLSKRGGKHNHNSSKCRHFYSAGGSGGQAGFAFPGCIARLVASHGSRVSCRLSGGQMG